MKIPTIKQERISINFDESSNEDLIRENNEIHLDSIRALNGYTPDFKFKCGFCSCFFMGKGNLNDHKNVKSYGTQKHECDKCEFFSCNKMALGRHKSKMHPAAKCNICKKSFSKNENLEQHLKRNH